MPDDLELHQRVPHALDVHLEGRDRKADHALELVVHTRAHGLRDLAELQAVLDDDAELDHEPVVANLDVDALA